MSVEVRCVFLFFLFLLLLLTSSSLAGASRPLPTASQTFETNELAGRWRSCAIEAIQALNYLLLGARMLLSCGGVGCEVTLETDGQVRSRARSCKSGCCPCEFCFSVTAGGLQGEHTHNNNNGQTKEGHATNLFLPAVVSSITLSNSERESDLASDESNCQRVCSLRPQACRVVGLHNKVARMRVCLLEWHRSSAPPRERVCGEKSCLAFHGWAR